VVTPDQAIDAIRQAGGAQPGYRALHAKGKLYRGTFTASPEAGELCRAAHLTGSTVPALIRFSSGSGNPKQPDNAPGVRGMAVKFTLPDGSTTDVSTQTAKLFPASTPDGFISLLGAMRPGITAPLRLAGYVATHPRFLTVLPVLRDANRVPASYGTVAYHGLHAFRWVAADGSARFVRYHLLPAAGEEFLSPQVARTKGANFLIEELDERLASQPVRFDYQIQIAADGDSTVDPSRPWHSTKTVSVGIEPSDDPVLRFRTLAYSASVKLRTGVDRGPEAPPS
jgi:catalase